MGKLLDFKRENASIQDGCDPYLERLITVSEIIADWGQMESDYDTEIYELSRHIELAIYYYVKITEG